MVNIRQKPRRKGTYSVFDFTAASGEQYTWRLKPLDAMQVSSAAEFGADLAARYVTGGWIDQNGDIQPSKELVLYDEEPIDFSTDFCDMAAIIERMQGIKRQACDDAPVEGGHLCVDLACLMLSEDADAWAALKNRVKVVMRDPKALTVSGTTPPESA